MEITNVGVRLIPGSRDRLKAFCTITFDDEFVVRDLKVVEGPSGLFVAMPSRKRMSRCSRCSHKNEVRSHFCNGCGAALPPERVERTQNNGKPGSHTDIAHPINSECRERVQHTVLEAFQRQLEEHEARRAAGHDRDPEQHEDDMLEDFDAVDAHREPAGGREPVAGPRDGARGHSERPREKSPVKDRIVPAPQTAARVAPPPSNVPADEAFGAGIL